MKGEKPKAEEIVLFCDCHLTRLHPPDVDLLVRGRTGREMRLGVISDTHGKFDEAVVPIFTGVDLIIHSGDVGNTPVITRLEQIAPVLAVEGNNDSPGLFPAERVERLAGRTILVRHIFGELYQIGKKEREIVERLAPDIVIFGHSHRPYQGALGNTILFNPGSAGPKRFSLPRTVGLISIRDSGIETQIKHLE
jgi:putative phosphoesterase